MEQGEFGGADGGEEPCLEFERDERGVVEQMPGKRRRQTGHQAVGLFAGEKAKKLVGGEGQLRCAVGDAELGGTGREGVVGRDKGVVGEMGNADGKQLAEDVSLKELADLME